MRFCRRCGMLIAAPGPYCDTCKDHLDEELHVGIGAAIRNAMEDLPGAFRRLGEAATRSAASMDHMGDALRYTMYNFTQVHRGRDMMSARPFDPDTPHVCVVCLNQINALDMVRSVPPANYVHADCSRATAGGIFRRVADEHEATRLRALNERLLQDVSELRGQLEATHPLLKEAHETIAGLKKELAEALKLRPDLMAHKTQKSLVQTTTKSPYKARKDKT